MTETSPSWSSGVYGPVQEHTNARKLHDSAKYIYIFLLVIAFL